jgi:nucleoside-diphosphate-sugar epimerase
MHAKRVLVSGAGGFIGRWSIPALQRLGYDVHAVMRGDARVIPEQLRGATVHRADLLQDTAAEELLSAVRPSHLLHFAWIATPGQYWSSAENFRWLDASRRMLRCFDACGGQRVMMAGSCAEYDWSRAAVCNELSSPPASGAELSPYAACKVALQAELAEFGRRERLSTAWGRIFFQFGPFEHPDRLVPSVIGNLLRNREAPLSHGRQIRSFLHVADVGAAFAAVLDGEVEGPVNIGAEEGITLAELAGRIGRLIGRPELLRLGARPAAPGEPPILLPDVRRLRDEAGWRPTLTLDEGLRDTIAWWRAELGHAAAAGGGLA